MKLQANEIAILRSANTAALSIAGAEHLAERAAALISANADAGTADATKRALAGDSAALAAWCSHHGLASVPLAPAAVVLYVAAMAHGVCAADCAACIAWHSEQSARCQRWQPWHRPASIRRHLASVAALHRTHGFTSPTGAEPVRGALRAISKALGARQRQAPALRWQTAARQMLAALDARRVGDLRDAALLSVAIDTAARRSELAALDVADLTVLADGFGEIVIRRSKTDQAGEGMTRVLAADTVRRLVAWQEAAGISTGALFRSVGKSGRVGGRLPAGDVPRIFNRLAARAGIAQRFTGHSTRVGRAQDLADAACSVVEIQLAGGWKSPAMVGRYTQALDQGRVARRLAAIHGRD